MRRWGRSLLVIGVALLLPGACAVATGTLTDDDDAAIAFTPVVRLSLESLKAGAPLELSFRVPDSLQWKRIRQDRRMGDNGYVILATKKDDDRLVPFSNLNLEVEVSGRTGQFTLNKADYVPYGHFSDTLDVGRLFRPSPGEEVQVRLRAQTPRTLPTGELIIKPYWRGTAKDFLVGASLDSEFQPIVVRMTQAGFGLLGLGLAVNVLAWFRGSKSSPS